MGDDVEQLKRRIRWLEDDLEHLRRSLDDARTSLREANNRVLDLAHARVVDAEERLAKATLDAREPDVKLH
jgi:hypothetical protein